MRLRKASRLVLLDDQQRILLFKIALSSGETLWVPPGGGLEEGETHEEAALRELWEETAIRGAELGPWVWTRDTTVDWEGEQIRSYEQYYLVRVSSGEISLNHLLPHELAVYRDHRWWGLEEMRASNETFKPPGLVQLLAPLVGGRLPGHPVLIAI